MLRELKAGLMGTQIVRLRSRRAIVLRDVNDSMVRGLGELLKSKSWDLGTQKAERCSGWLLSAEESSHVSGRRVVQWRTRELIPARKEYQNDFGALTCLIPLAFGARPDVISDLSMHSWPIEWLRDAV